MTNSANLDQILCSAASDLSLPLFANAYLSQYLGLLQFNRICRYKILTFNVLQFLEKMHNSSPAKEVKTKTEMHINVI